MYVLKQCDLINWLAGLRYLLTRLSTVLVMFMAAKAGAEQTATGLQTQAALVGPQAQNASMLALACAGARAVAVGDHGVVLLSDDGGKQWRQARQVPVDVLLTSVSFSDSQHGWAVGHWGVVLRTDDAGETWKLQRSVLEEDRPLFAVHFFNANDGIAVGLWSQVLRTADGGSSWVEQTTGFSKASGISDLNLYNLFADAKGVVYATAEKGRLLWSADQGRHWAVMETGAAGSLWSGVALDHGQLLVAGLRGILRLSEDGGRHWSHVGGDVKDSLTGVAALDAKHLMVVGVDGQQLFSENGGKTFQSRRRVDKLSLNAVGTCSSGARPLMLSVRGPASEDASP